MSCRGLCAHNAPMQITLFLRTRSWVSAFGKCEANMHGRELLPTPCKGRDVERPRRQACHPLGSSRVFPCLQPQTSVCAIHVLSRRRTHVQSTPAATDRRICNPCPQPQIDACAIHARSYIPTHVPPCPQSKATEELQEVVQQLKEHSQLGAEKVVGEIYAHSP